MNYVLPTSWQSSARIHMCRPEGRERGRKKCEANITGVRPIWKNKMSVLTLNIGRNDLTWRGETIFFAGGILQTTWRWPGCALAISNSLLNFFFTFSYMLFKSWAFPALSPSGVFPGWCAVTQGAHVTRWMFLPSFGTKMGDVAAPTVTWADRRQISVLDLYLAAF